MTKKLILTIILILPLITKADFVLSDWRYYKNIKISESGLVRVGLDDEIFSNAQNDLDDLRIVNNEAREIPFKLVAAKSKQETVKYNPQIINNSYLPGQYSSAILDFGENNTGINRLKINTGAENFLRNVRVYGSDNTNNWALLEDDIYIYDHTERRVNFSAQDTTIDFPESIYRYLKIEIADNENVAVKIDSVEAYKHIYEKAREEKRTPKYEIKENTEEKITEIYINLEQKGLPISKIELQVKTANYNRQAIIYSSNDNENWKKIDTDYIFRYNTSKFNGSKRDLNFSETQEQYLKVVIKNNDNEPLVIEDLKTLAIYQEIIFEAERGKDYRLYYGNDQAKRAQYDIEKYFSYLNLDKAQEAHLTPQIDNESYVFTDARPMTERNPYLLPVFLGVACLVLMFLVYGFLKKDK